MTLEEAKRYLEDEVATSFENTEMIKAISIVLEELNKEK